MITPESSSLVAKAVSLDFSKYFSSAVASLINPTVDGRSDFLTNFSPSVNSGSLSLIDLTSSLVANELKSCSGTVTELSEPEIVIVLPVIVRVCLSESSLVSKALTLPLTSSSSFLVAKLDSVDLAIYFSSALVSEINPVVDGNSSLVA